MAADPVLDGPELAQLDNLNDHRSSCLIRRAQHYILKICIVTCCAMPLSVEQESD